MKNKKGFTLIEIIIAITLIVLIGGVTTTLVIKSNNNKKTLEEITKKVLEAANVFIETEKDELGNYYSKGINSGGKGVRIPLNTLVDKGYVKESDSNEIKKLSKLTDSDYYVLLVDGDYPEKQDYCKTGALLTIASWTIDDTKKDKPIYLCDYETTNAGEDFINTLLNAYGGESKIPTLTDEQIKNDFIVSSKKTGPSTNTFTTDQMYEIIQGTDGNAGHWDYITYQYTDGINIEVIETECKSNGLFKKKPIEKDGKIITTYYYRGDVADNYINNNARILNFTVTKTSGDIESITFKTVANVSNMGWKGCELTKINEISEKNKVFKCLYNDYEEFNKYSIYPENLNFEILSSKETFEAGIFNISSKYNLKILFDDEEILSVYSDESHYPKQFYYFSNNSFLGDTSGLIYDNENSKFYYISNKKIIHENGGLLFTLKGFLLNADSTLINDLNNEMSAKSTITLNAKGIHSFSGTGTKNNPYILNCNVKDKSNVEVCKF